MPIGNIQGFYDALLADKKISEEDMSKDEFTELFMTDGEFRHGLFHSLQRDKIYGDDEPYQTFIDDLGITSEDTLSQNVPTNPTVSPSDTPAVGQEEQPQKPQQQQQFKPLDFLGPLHQAQGLYEEMQQNLQRLGQGGKPMQPGEIPEPQQQQGYGGFLVPDTSQMGLNAPQKVSVTAPTPGLTAAIKGIGAPMKENPTPDAEKPGYTDWREGVSTSYNTPVGGLDAPMGGGYSAIFRDFVGGAVTEAIKRADAAGSQASDDFLNKHRMSGTAMAGTSGGATGAALWMMGEKEGNKKRDPEAIMKEIERALPEMITGNKPLMDYIARSAEENKISRGEFTRAIMPILLNDIRRELYRQLVDRKLPKDDIHWMVDGIMDSATGKLYEWLTDTKGGQEITNYAREMTQAGENPYYQPGFWADTGRFAASLFGKIPEFAAFGGLGTKATGALFGTTSSMARLTAAGYTEAQAAGALAMQRAGMSAGRRILLGAAEHSVSGAITLGGVDSMDEALRQLRDREDFDIWKVAGHGGQGALTGVLFGSTGGAWSGLTARATGLGRLWANIAGFEIESAVMGGMTSYERWKAGEHLDGKDLVMDWLKGNVQTAVMKGVNQHGVTAYKNLFFNRGPQVGKGFSKEAQEDLDALAKQLGVDRMNIYADVARGRQENWTLETDKEGRAVMKQKEKKIDPLSRGGRTREEVGQIFTQFMTDPTKTWEARNAVAEALGLPSLPKPGAHRTEVNGTEVATWDLQGNFLETKNFKTPEEAYSYAKAVHEESQLRNRRRLDHDNPIASQYAAGMVTMGSEEAMEAVGKAFAKPEAERTAEDKALIDDAKKKQNDLYKLLSKQESELTDEELKQVRAFDRILEEEVLQSEHVQTIIVNRPYRNNDNVATVQMLDADGKIIHETEAMSFDEANSHATRLTDRMGSNRIEMAENKARFVTVCNTFGTLLVADFAKRPETRVKRYEELTKAKGERELTEAEETERAGLENTYQKDKWVQYLFENQKTVEKAAAKSLKGEELTEGEQKAWDTMQKVQRWYMRDPRILDGIREKFEEECDYASGTIADVLAKPDSERSEAEKNIFDEYMQWVSGRMNNRMKSDSQLAFDYGWNATPEQRADIRDKFAAADADLRQRMGYDGNTDIARVLGLTEGNEEKIKTRIRRGNNTPEEKKAAITWINLRSQMRGVEQSVESDVIARIDAANKDVDMKAGDDGMIREVTLTETVKDENGQDIPVKAYIKSGTIFANGDGTINEGASDRVIFVRVPGDDGLRPIDVRTIKSLDGMYNTEEYRNDAVTKAEAQARAEAYMKVEPMPEEVAPQQEGQPAGQPAGQPTGQPVEGGAQGPVQGGTGEPAAQPVTRRITIAGEDYNVEVLGEENGRVKLKDLESGEEYDLSRERFDAFAKAADDKAAAAQAEAAAQAQREENRKAGITGYAEGNPDLSHPDNDMQLVIDYLKEQEPAQQDRVKTQAATHIGTLNDNIESMEADVARRREWYENAKDMSTPENLSARKEALDKAEAELAEAKARRDNWERVRVALMSDKELNAMKEERKASRQQWEAEEQEAQKDSKPALSGEKAPLDKDAVLEKYETRGEAYQAMLSEFRRHDRRVGDIDNRIRYIDKQLDAWRDGEPMTEQEVRALIAEREALRKEDNMLRERMAALGKTAKKQLAGWYKEREQANMSESELKYAQLDKETDYNRKMKLAKEAVMSDKDIDGSDRDLLLMILDRVEPETVEEFVAENLPYGSINWEGLIGDGGRKIRGLKDELGGRRGIGHNYDTNAYNAYLAKKGEGKSPDQIAHEMWEASPEDGDGNKRWSDVEIKQAMLDLLQGAEKPTDISHRLPNDRIEEVLQMRDEMIERHAAEEEQARREYEQELKTRYEEENETVDERGGLVINGASERMSDYWQGTLHALGRNIGRRVEIVSKEYLKERYGDDAAKMNGFYDKNTNTFYLNEERIDDESVRAFTSGHEITHILQDEASPEIWNAYIDAVRDAMGAEAFDAEFKRIRKQYDAAYDRMNKFLPEGEKLRYLTDEEIKEEIGANWAGKHVFSDRDAVQDIVRRAESAGADPVKLTQRVLNWINGKIATLKKALGMGEDVEKELSDMEKAKALWQEMYDIATARQNERMKEDNQREATNEGEPVIGDEQLPFSLSNDASEREHQERLLERNGIDADDVETERDFATAVAMDETGIGGTKVEGAGTQKFSFSAHANASGFDAYEIVEETRTTKDGKTITEEKYIPHTDEAGNVILKVKGKDGVERIFSADNPITVEDFEDNTNSSWELMLGHAKELGAITDETAATIRRKLVGLLNLGLELGSAKEGGVKSLMNRWQWVGETVFKTIAKNGDPQYGTSADITRACKKNEQMIFAISERQKEQGYGVTPGQIIELYRSIEEEGYQTPCPVCYVFSRYIRNGKYANGIINGMKKYGEHLPGGSDEWTAAQWKAELDRLDELKKATTKEVTRATNDIDEIPDLIDDLWKELNSGVTDERRAEIEKSIAELDDRYRKALDVYGQVALTNWIKTFAIKSKNSKYVLRNDVKIPRTEEEWEDFKEHALDIRLTASVYRNYPAIQRMRKSAGSPGGKEITFASDNRPGEVAIGIGREKEGDLINYYDRAIHAPTAKQRSDARSKAKKELEKSINIAAQQTLRGGQRMWSWSDNIERLAGDVVQNLIQMEIVKGAVQSYSKQLEGVHMVAKMGAYVNGSLMARGEGYAEVAPENTKVVNGVRVTTTDIKGQARKNGKIEERVFSEAGAPVYEENGKYYTAIFDDVVGIDPFSHDTADGKHMEGLFELNGKLDKAGNIMVGMNDMHIRTCLSDPRIFFIIPWHSSGQSVHILQQMMNILGVEFKARNAVDYTNMQEEKKLDDGGVNDRVRELWERVMNETDWKCGIEGGIENGDGENLSAGQRRYRFLRAQIFNGNAFKDVPELPKKPKRTKKMTDEAYSKKMAEYEEQMQYWQNPKKDLAKIKEEIKNDFFLSKVYDAVEKVPSKKMTTDDNNYIYPYEYWDETSTYDTADVNGARYLEYCRRLGRKPKFSGRWDTTDETLMNIGNFMDSKGYWKLLIDRRMYDVNGKYQGLTPVDSSGHDTHDADPRWTKDHFLVTRVADDTATKGIVSKAMERERERMGDNPAPNYDDYVLGYLPGEERGEKISAVERHQEAVAATDETFKTLSKAHAEKLKAQEEMKERRKAQEAAARQQAQRQFSFSPEEQSAVDEATAFVTGRDVEEVRREREEKAIAQGHGSAATSIKQTPGGMKKVEWKSGTTNVDIGGGRFDDATEWLRERGVENLVFDPFNRDSEHNRMVAERVRKEKVDTATCHNVLNVIDSESSRANVILQAAKAIKPDGTAYFSIYEGDKTGVGKYKGQDRWQNNRRTKDYLGEIERYFDDVQVKKGVIIARSPKPTEEQSVWDFDGQYSGNSIRFSLAPEHQKRTYDEMASGDVPFNGKVKGEDEPSKFRIIDDEKKSFTNYRGTKIGRYQDNVGKLMGGVYVHKDYATDIIPEDIYTKAAEVAEREGFKFNSVYWDKKNPNIVRFDEAPDFDTAREPIPGNWIKVDASTGEIVGHGNSNQIWHHKWAWVKDDYQGFDVDDAYNWSKEWSQKISNPDAWGYKWDYLLDQAGLPKDWRGSALSARPDEEGDVRFSIQDEIKRAEEETETNLSDAQKKAGNYKKGHVKIDGFDFTIEQPKGSVRSGVDESGKEWSTKMNNTYGYIRGTEGADGDHVDVFFSDHMDDWNGMVFVVDQVKKDGSFDEHKVMYGFNDYDEAWHAYHSNYEKGWKGLGDMNGITLEGFKKWLNSSDRQSKDFAEYAFSGIIREKELKDSNGNIIDRDKSITSLDEAVNVINAVQAEAKKEMQAKPTFIISEKSELDVLEKLGVNKKYVEHLKEIYDEPTTIAYYDEYIDEVFIFPNNITNHRFNARQTKGAIYHENTHQVLAKNFSDNEVEEIAKLIGFHYPIIKEYVDEAYKDDSDRIKNEEIICTLIQNEIEKGKYGFLNNSSDFKNKELTRHIDNIAEYLIDRNYGQKDKKSNRSRPDEGRDEKNAQISQNPRGMAASDARGGRTLGKNQGTHQGDEGEGRDVTSLRIGEAEDKAYMDVASKGDEAKAGGVEFVGESRSTSRPVPQYIKRWLGSTTGDEFSNQEKDTILEGYNHIKAQNPHAIAMIKTPKGYVLINEDRRMLAKDLGTTFAPFVLVKPNDVDLVRSAVVSAGKMIGSVDINDNAWRKAAVRPTPQPKTSAAPEGKPLSNTATTQTEKDQGVYGWADRRRSVYWNEEPEFKSVSDAAWWCYDLIGNVRSASERDEYIGKDYSRLLSLDDSHGEQVDVEKAKKHAGMVIPMAEMMKKHLIVARDRSKSEAAARYVQGLIDECDNAIDWYQRAAKGDRTIFDDERPRMFRVSRDGKGLDKKTVDGTWTESEVRVMEGKLGGTKVTIDTEETIPETVRRRLLLGEDVKGWYDESDGSVHLYAPAIESVEDARYTICHEKLGHEGLTALLGSQQAVTDWGNFMYLSASRDLRAQMDEIARTEFAGDDNAKSKAAQEVFAQIAEDGPRSKEEFSLWRRVKHFFIKQAQKRGWNVRGLLNDADMRYYVLKTGEALKRYEGMDDAQKMETSRPGLLFSTGGSRKPRKRQNESMASFLQRLERWEVERQREEDMRLAGAEAPEKEPYEQQWQAKYEEDDAAWRERHGLTGDEPEGYPRRQEGESDESLMQRVREYEQWENAMRDQDDKRPIVWEYEQKAYHEWRDAVKEFERQWGIEDEDHAALDLFDPPSDGPVDVEQISPSGRPMTPEEAAAEHATLQELGDALGADMSARGAKRHTKLAVIQRRKDLEGRSAEDAIYVHELSDKIDAVARRLIDETGAKDQSKKEVAEKIRHAIPFIIEIPRRQREIADDINSSLVWQYGRLVTINGDDIAAASRGIDDLRDAINRYGIDSEEAKDAARRIADIINARHEGDIVGVIHEEVVNNGAVEYLTDLMNNTEPAHRGGKPIPETTPDEIRQNADDLERLRLHLSQLAQAINAGNVGEVRDSIVGDINAVADRYVEAFNARHAEEISNGSRRAMTTGDLIDIMWLSRTKLKENAARIGVQGLTGSDVLAIGSMFTRRVLPEEVDFPIDRVQDIVDDIGDWYSNWFMDIENAGLRPQDIGRVTNYVNHRWEHESGLGAKIGDENYQRTRSANMRERTIPTLMTGLEVGLTPKSTDIVDLMSYYSRHNAEAVANKGLIDALENVKIYETDADGEPVASVSLLTREEPELAREKYELYDIPGQGLVWVHKEASNWFANVFGPIHTSGEKSLWQKTVSAYDTASSTAKKIELSFSGFHMGALTEVYIAQMIAQHPKDGLQTFVKFMITDCIKKGTLPCYANPEVYKDAAKHLVKLGANDDYANKEVVALTAKFREMLKDTEQKMAEAGLGKTASKAVMATDRLIAYLLDWANNGMDAILWSYLHDGLKLAAYDIYARDIRKRAPKEGWDETTIDQMLDEAGQYVNDMFGGQYWEIINVSPAQLKLMQRFLLSPDWLISTNRHFFANFGFGSLYSDQNFKEYLKNNWGGLKRLLPKEYRSEKDIYRAFRSTNSKWCYLLGVLVFNYLFWNGVNFLNRKKDIEEQQKIAEERRAAGDDQYMSPYESIYGEDLANMKWWDYTMFGNAMEKKTHAFYGRGSGGQEVYLRWGKQFREFPELFENEKGEADFPFPLMNRLLSKANPMASLLFESLMYSSPRRQTYWDKRLIEQYGMHTGYLMKIASRFKPFSMPSDEKESTWIGLVFPTSKGFTFNKAKDYLRDFMEREDWEGVREVYRACALNGIDFDAAYNIVANDIEKTARQASRSGIESKSDAVKRFDASNSLSERKTLMSTIENYQSKTNARAMRMEEAVETAKAEFTSDKDDDPRQWKDYYILGAKGSDIEEDSAMSWLKRQCSKYKGHVKYLEETEGDVAANLYRLRTMPIQNAAKNLDKVWKELNELKKEYARAYAEGQQEKADETMRKIREKRSAALERHKKLAESIVPFDETAGASLESLGWVDNLNEE